MDLVKKKKLDGLLKFFFKKKNYCGGWARGKKVFWGQVSYSSSKILYINFDKKYSFLNIKGIIQKFFLLSSYSNKLFSFIFFPTIGIISVGLKESSNKIGDNYLASFFKPVYQNSSLTISTCLSNIILGSLIFSLQSNYLGVGKFSLSGGCYSKLLNNASLYTIIQLPSKKNYLLPSTYFATIGTVSLHKTKRLTKAGQSWWLGSIPKVRGIAMNPVDHPHGGRANGGKHPWTPKGLLAKGQKTWKRVKWSDKWIFNLIF